MHPVQMRAHAAKVVPLIGVLLLLVFLMGCTDVAPGLIPFAQADNPARLTLNVRVNDPAGAAASSLSPLRTQAKQVSGQAKRKAVVRLPLAVARVVVDVGRPTEPDHVGPKSFDLTAATGAIEEFTISNIPPGFAKLVTLSGLDASGQVIASTSFFLDFFPGQISSNDADLDVISTAQGTPPTNPATNNVRYAVVNGSSTIEIVDVGAKTTRQFLDLSAAGLSPLGIAADRNGSIFVSTGTLVVRADPGGSVQTVVFARPPPPAGLYGAIRARPQGDFVINADPQALLFTGNTTPTVFGSTRSAVEPLAPAVALAVDAIGNAFTLNNVIGPPASVAVNRVNPDPTGNVSATQLFQVPVPPSALFPPPSLSVDGLAVEANGNFLLGFFLNPQSEIHRFGPTGADLGAFRLLSTATASELPDDFIRDSIGDIALATGRGRSVQRLSPAGQIGASFSSNVNFIPGLISEYP